MNETLILMLGGAAGAVLGAIFFGTLWWTVGKGLKSPHPVLWFAGSMLLRIGLILAGFYFVSGGQWKRLLACLVGFFVARVVVTWLMRSSRKTQTSSAQEASHAS